MVEDAKTPGEPIRTRIDVDDPREVEYWTREFGVTEEHLRRLVAKYGASADALRRAMEHGAGSLNPWPFAPTPVPGQATTDKRPEKSGEDAGGTCQP